VKNTNIFKLSSSTNKFATFNLNQMLLENCALRYSTNIFAPEIFKKQQYLPGNSNFKYAYPFEHNEIKNSILKYKNDIILEPPNFNPKPINDRIKRGSTITLFYNNTNIKGVFFKYTMIPAGSEVHYNKLADIIPTYFNGKLVFNKLISLIKSTPKTQSQ